jgi:hypothetical protein
VSTPFLGPDAELIRRSSLAMNAPLLIDDPELNDRLVAALERASTFSDLPEEMQRLIEQGEEQVRAGLSPTLVNPADWTGDDWASEDAQADAGDDAADDDSWVGV